MDSMSERPRLALLGCGTFSRDAYLPILKNLQSQLSLRFIWSQSQASAQRMLLKVHEFSPETEAKWDEHGLQSILTSIEVHCCAIVLPILSQPSIVVRAMQAGKHVLQAVAEAIATLHKVVSDAKAARIQTPIWAMAENFRFEPAFFEAREMIKGLGQLVVFQVSIEVPMNYTNKYFESEWRRDPMLKGGFILDCGVHFVAGLRTMLGGLNVSLVSGIATHRDPRVPSPDTLTTLLTLENGCSGVMVITYSSSNNKSTWRVVCSQGAVEVERGLSAGKFGFTVKMTPLEGEETVKFIAVQGLEEELRVFAGDVVKSRNQDKHTPDPRGSPTEALQDLAVVETALSSGLDDNAPVALRPPTISESLWPSLA